MHRDVVRDDLAGLGALHLDQNAAGAADPVRAPPKPRVLWVDEQAKVQDLLARAFLEQSDGLILELLAVPGGVIPRERLDPDREFSLPAHELLPRAPPERLERFDVQGGGRVGSRQQPASRLVPPPRPLLDAGLFLHLPHSRVELGVLHARVFAPSPPVRSILSYRSQVHDAQWGVHDWSIPEMRDGINVPAYKRILTPAG